ncbi:acyl-CoA hydrolase [Phycomyces nitens]|nr:acyl-CoA hydrolase [Phycomyces nitens]
MRRSRFWMDKIMERENLKPLGPPTAFKNRILVKKTMSDSYIEEFLPFKSSPDLMDQYIFVDGRIRTGKLLEDLDSLAGAIAYKHVDTGDPDAPPTTIVTASVDRLDLMMPDAVENYKLSGHVSYVGNSSMEIFIKAETISEDYDMSENTPKTVIKPEDIGMLGPNTILATRFTMVALDAYTNKPINVNPLITTSPAEKRMFEFAKANKRRKQKTAENALTRQPPTPDERLAIHDIFLQYSQYCDASEDSFTSTTLPDGRMPLPDNLMWMSDTRLQSNFLMQPQDRNIHNNIFGGYLMRRAFELAYAEAALFTNTPGNNLLAMDQVIFRKPVHVGAVLNLKAGVVHAEGYPHRTLQLRVVAQVVDIHSGKRETTNVFYFTMACTDDSVKVKRVLPRTYAETMLWLAGHRRRIQGIKARQLLLDELSDHYHGKQ